MVGEKHKAILSKYMIFFSKIPCLLKLLTKSISYAVLHVNIHKKTRQHFIMIAKNLNHLKLGQLIH